MNPVAALTTPRESPTLKLLTSMASMNRRPCGAPGTGPVSARAAALTIGGSLSGALVTLRTKLAETTRRLRPSIVTSNFSGPEIGDWHAVAIDDLDVNRHEIDGGTEGRLLGGRRSRVRDQQDGDNGSGGPQGAQPG